MKEQKTDFLQYGIVGAALLFTFICFPFYFLARMAHAATEVIAKVASHGSLIHEVAFWAYSPFATRDMAQLTVLGVIYAGVPFLVGLLPAPLGVVARRVTAAYFWIGLGLYVVLGALTALCT